MKVDRVKLTLTRLSASLCIDQAQRLDDIVNHNVTLNFLNPSFHCAANLVWYNPVSIFDSQSELMSVGSTHVVMCQGNLRCVLYLYAVAIATAS